MTDDGTTHRRSVLRTSAAALAGTGLVAGSASADHITSGCARATVGTPIFEECAGARTGDFFEQGDTAKVLGTCTDDTGYPYAFVEPADRTKYSRLGFWVYDGDLEPC